VRLLLLRHAKSDWSGAHDEDDHDRPLSERGVDAAPKIAAYMRSHGYDPALVLCSTSRRTKETLKLIVPAFAQAPQIRYTRQLYLAEWPQLLAEVRKAPPAASPLLVIGHNPGIHQLALALSLQPRGAAEQSRAQELARKFPTGALAVFDFDGTQWLDVKPGAGRLVDYTRPKDLPIPGTGS
jgi:phosphohistidine phosphatase